MRALLLAAGLGTRLRPITDSVPKCLVPIRGRPLLGYWFDILFRGGVDRALVNLHYHADAVRSFIPASPWRGRIETVYEEKLLGTAGTARPPGKTEFDIGASSEQLLSNVTRLAVSFEDAPATAQSKPGEFVLSGFCVKLW